MVRRRRKSGDGCVVGLVLEMMMDYLSWRCEVWRSCCGKFVVDDDDDDIVLSLFEAQP